MNKNKELLIKDLVCRLPYNIKCLVEIDETEFDEISGKDIGFKGKSIGELYVLDMNDNHVELYFNEKNNISDELSDMSMEGLITINDIKPYLRPMSSMTEKEKQEMSDGSSIAFEPAMNGVSGYCPETMAWSVYNVDYCISHHLDYRGLIEKGLALEAPEGMYN